MRTESELRTSIDDLEQAVSGLRGGLELAVRRRDWHGAMDAAADIREAEAELKTLRWVLE